MKHDGQKMVVMTAYDYELARIVDRADVEMVLVGDSGARYALGHADVNAATMDEMVLLARSARRGVRRALVVGDLPFLSYQVSVEEAVRNAGRLVKEARGRRGEAEGGEAFAPTVQAIGARRHSCDGAHGPDAADDDRRRWLREPRRRGERRADPTRRLCAAGGGVFSLVFTRVPPALAATLTRELRVPTLEGGGSGDDCDGQVCVLHNVFGLSVDPLDAPPSAYGPLALPIFDAALSFVADVRAGKPVRSQRESERDA